MMEARKDRSDPQGGPAEGLTSKEGLTNGAANLASSGMEVDVGLINGLARGKKEPRRPAPRLLIGSKRRERAARKALGRKASEPLPGSGGQ